jgi:hypothetical protein
MDASAQGKIENGCHRLPPMSRNAEWSAGKALSTSDLRDCRAHHAIPGNMKC